MHFAHSLLFVPTYSNWAGPSSLCFPSHFPSPLPPSLSIKLPPLVPPRTRGWVIYLGVAPDGIDWCDMNNTRSIILSRNYFSPTILIDMFLDEKHGFIKLINFSNFQNLVLGGIDWCDMNNTPTRNYFSGLDETHGFIQFINLSNFVNL